MEARSPSTEDGFAQGHGLLGRQARLAIPRGAALVPLLVGSFLLGDSHWIAGTQNREPSILAMAWDHVKPLGVMIWLQLLQEGNIPWPITATLPLLRQR
ncbi:MAG: hypothetical protein TH68_10550 [Candidatus Synechococcus spongiarum 142]|uniref:Uncharacterized protein n=1 Tax=Candidatus Synechococcus spongiarum 142 TaxID=1608213 RepID=A0A6N3X2H1_9SYNE|nr:MAG: hypothetical protein TH68_10550 [Candidatus Synechococcus spongiarum 142]